MKIFPFSVSFGSRFQYSPQDVHRSASLAWGLITCMTHQFHIGAASNQQVQMKELVMFRETKKVRGI